MTGAPTRAGVTTGVTTGGPPGGRPPQPRPGTEVRPRPGLALVPGQVRYQLLLLTRNPLGSFITLVVPLMLLIALDLVTPEMTLQSLGGMHVIQFLTPAMASFAVLNAAFVDVLVGTTVARDHGILRRLHGTPLPTWVLLAGRLGAAATVAAGSVVVVLGVGVVFLHAHLAASAVPGLVGATAVGLLVFFALGVVCSTLVPATEAALPVAYGLLLPVAFISEVFFPAPGEAAWLRSVASALPIAPFAHAMESAFAVPPHGMTGGQLAVLVAWGAGATVVTLFTFRWEPGGLRRRRARARSSLR